MPTRISGACNGCRAKKQKCNGDRNGCAQCEASSVPCTWPEQRKRGPAKGYIEGLEHRLHEAESLLLHLLPFISSEQLQVATSAFVTNDIEDLGRNSPDRRSSPPILNKKTGIDYWESFPLTSVDDVRRWQQDCEVHGTGLKENPVTSEHVNQPPQPSQRETSTRRKRPSDQELVSTSSDALAANRNLPHAYYGIQNGQAAPQSLGHDNSTPAVIRRQPQDAWKSTIIPSNNIMREHSIPNLSQQQFFSNAGYINEQAPAMWQSPLDVEIRTNEAVTGERSPTPAINSQTQAHLFW